MKHATPRDLGLFWSLAALVGVLGVLVGAQRKPAAALPELQELKRVNYLLESRNLTLQCQAAGQALEGKQHTLEAEFRTVLKPADGSVFDWEKGDFVQPPKPAEKPKGETP